MKDILDLCFEYIQEWINSWVSRDNILEVVSNRIWLTCKLVEDLIWKGKIDELFDNNL